MELQFLFVKEDISMGIELRKLTVSDDMEIYEMLQELPADENGGKIEKKPESAVMSG